MFLRSSLQLSRSDYFARCAAVEPNEAFAVKSLACLDARKIDPDIVNTRGGAIAIGHPWARPVRGC
jgi:acetyl-CoA acetyltransferase